MKWPIVIGLPTIRKENLVEKLKKHFSCEGAEAQEGHTAVRTLTPNVTQCGPPVDEQANMALLTSIPRAVGERKTRERVSPPDVDDDEFPWENLLKQKDACAEAMIIAGTQYAHPSACSHDCACPSCSTSSEEDTEDEISESKFMERLNTLIEPMTMGQSPDEEDLIPKEIHGPESLQQSLRKVCG